MTKTRVLALLLTALPLTAAVAAPGAAANGDPWIVVDLPDLDTGQSSDEGTCALLDESAYAGCVLTVGDEPDCVGDAGDCVGAARSTSARATLYIRRTPAACVVSTVAVVSGTSPTGRYDYFLGLKAPFADQHGGINVPGPTADSHERTLVIPRGGTVTAFAWIANRAAPGDAASTGDVTFRC